ncbi:scavenger receptor class B member 1 [Dermatophagoides farinae]|uniref:scavenger receptor class B member 1 n=1 Tax=Dermatophagoides farinae TaxID=6954 RepID=UPI003F5FDE0B
MKIEYNLYSIKKINNDKSSFINSNQNNDSDVDYNDDQRHYELIRRPPDYMAMMTNNDGSNFNLQQQQRPPLYGDEQQNQMMITLQPQELAMMNSNYQQPSIMIMDNHIQNDNNNHHYGSKKTLIGSELSLDKNGRKKKSIFIRLLWPIFAIFGLITLLISQSILLSSESVVLDGFAKQLDVNDASAILPAWKNIALDSEYYMFGIKNPDEFLRGSKPEFVEIGPFKYREFRRRKILEYKQDKVVFTERTHFQFKEHESRSMMETITVVNTPLLAILYGVKATIKKMSLNFLDPIVKNIMASILAATGEQIIERRTIYELLEGRQINLLILTEKLSKPLRSIGLAIPDLGELSEGSGNKIRNQTFGFIWQRADIDVGPYEYWRRTENGHIFSHVYMIEGRTLFPEFRSPCNVIRGSDGMHFGTKIQRDIIEVFNPQTCRPLRFLRNQSNSYVSGIETIRYDLDVHQIDMRIKNNRCFCLQTSLAKCDGWQDLSPCTSGIPLAISWPHFLDCPTRATQVLGLKPDRQRHSSHLNIEPNTGLTLEAKVSIQLGIKIDSTIPGFSSVPHMILPIFWTTQSGGPNETEMMQFKALVFLIHFGNIIFGTIALAISIMLFFCSCYSYKRQHKIKPIL